MQYIEKLLREYKHKLDTEPEKLALHKENFYYECHIDIEDELFDGRPFCKRVNCDKSRCEYNHLDWLIYCEYRYNCNDSACKKKHYDPRRKLTKCPGRDECENPRCPLVHTCQFGNKCNRPECQYYHDDIRCNNFCFDDLNCAKNDCSLVHSCSIRNCNNPLCKNPHKSRNRVKCALGKTCNIDKCSMSHDCAKMNDCNVSSCIYFHNECRKNTFCPMDSICRGRKNKTCELRHSSDTKSQTSATTKKKKTSLKQSAKSNNMFAKLAIN